MKLLVEKMRRRKECAEGHFNRRRGEFAVFVERGALLTLSPIHCTAMVARAKGRAA